MYQGRSEEIFENYLAAIDRILQDMVDGKSRHMPELKEIAGQLFIHPTHLSNVIKKLTGHHPCYFYENKIVAVAKALLNDSRYSIADVAEILSYDPSNFTKWFKTYAGLSPSQYRKQLAAHTAQLATLPQNLAKAS